MTVQAKPAILIEAYNRWDALDLARHLPRWSWYLISQGGERWDVVVRPDRGARRATGQLLDEVQAWANRREVNSVVHLGDADVAVHPESVR
jgi:hypothetical protein